MARNPDIKRFNFNPDFYDGCIALGEREGRALAWAILRYGYEGVEPEGLKPATMAAFSFARGRVDAIVNGCKGPAARGSRAVSAPGAEPMPDARSQGGAHGGAEPPCAPAPEHPSGQKEKEKEKEDIPLAGNICACPPTPEEVRAYFGANCLRGDPSQFFDHYEAVGWRFPSGLPVEDWRAAARMWSRRQVGFDADRKAQGRQTSQEVSRAAVWSPAATEEDEAARLDAELARMEGAA